MPPSRPEPKGDASSSLRSLSRRQFLIGAGGLAGAAALGAGTVEVVQQLSGSTLTSLPALPVRASGPVRTFHTLPHLRPATVKVDSDQDIDPAQYLFIAPWATDGNQPGPQLVDRGGDPVWFNHVPTEWASNFKAYTYRGQPVLAWWQGIVRGNGYGQGEAVIMDGSYQEVARVRPVGRAMDLHELTLSPQGTALFTCYPNWVTHDLTSIGGAADGRVIESVFQEVDIRTGKLLLEWNSLDHIPVEDSYNSLGEPFDYLHLNSIDVLPDGNLLVSGRFTWSLYKLDRRTGEVIWRLGGKRTQFEMGPHSQFFWQHHAAQPMPGTITVFDNGSNGYINTETRSRGIRLGVDYGARKVNLVQSYHHPKPLLAQAMGSVQLLPGGNALVGWGEEPFVSEFDASDSLLDDARMLSGYKSYRSYRLPWRGTPSYRPAITAHREPATGKVTLYASWNGATDVAYWRIHAGASASDLKEIGIAQRRAFETAIPLGRGGGYIAAAALDAAGHTLGHSAPIRV